MVQDGGALWAENAAATRHLENRKHYSNTAGGKPPDSPSLYEKTDLSEKHISHNNPPPGGDTDGAITPYPTGTVAGKAASRPAMTPPALVAAMTPERRVEAENHLRRKIDIRLMPMAVIMYIMNYLDRNNIAAARLGGLEKDLGLEGTEYQVCPFSLSLFRRGFVTAAKDFNVIS